ncbi:hypothetical protein EHW66_03095 [Erwinia psidii]|uniref:hypothetical protein n=1 Tax=Erwinia psidii TaxID=69224 RepID=UPI00226B315A|nr:hypothetical protein [Erwinia psidii]MCX8964032.1 hypothetical protein [Erwinia psidii]
MPDHLFRLPQPRHFPVSRCSNSCFSSHPFFATGKSTERHIANAGRLSGAGKLILTFRREILPTPGDCPVLAS